MFRVEADRARIKGIRLAEVEWFHMPVVCIAILTVFVEDGVTAEREDEELRKHFILMDDRLIKPRQYNST